MKKLMFLLSVLLVTSTALAGKGEGGGGGTKKNPIVLATKYEVESAIERAPQLLSYYLNFFETIEWGYSTPTLDRDAFVDFVSNSILKQDYQNLLLNRSALPVEVRSNIPCTFTIPESGKVITAEGSAQDGKICLSISEILKKQHTLETVDSKVLGLFAHEFAHISGAGHDRQGELLANGFQEYIEVLSSNIRFENLNEVIRNAKDIFIYDLELPSQQELNSLKGNLLKSCMMLSNLINNIRSFEYVSVINATQSSQTTILNPYLYTLMKSIEMRSIIGYMNCDDDPKINSYNWSDLFRTKLEGDTIKMEEFLVKVFGERIGVKMREAVINSKKTDKKIFTALELPRFGDLRKIENSLNKIIYEFRVLEKEVMKLEEIK